MYSLFLNNLGEVIWPFLSYVNVIKLSGHKSITHFMWCDRLSIARVDSRKNQVEEL